MMSSNETVRPITAKETYDLRHRVLRPNQPLAECQYSLDKSKDARHIGCFAGDFLAGIGTIFREDREGRTDREVWRIRGMAVAPEFQRKGIGGKVLVALIAHAKALSPTGEIWCNGRANVRSFYEHFGFTQDGEEFELPAIGRHVVLLKKLRAVS